VGHVTEVPRCRLPARRNGTRAKRLIPSWWARIGNARDQQRLREAALDALRSEQVIEFLAALTWELTLAARREYGLEGSAPGSEYPLRSYNELHQHADVPGHRGAARRISERGLH
jgi:hypothetical protein